MKSSFTSNIILKLVVVIAAVLLCVTVTNAITPNEHENVCVEVRYSLPQTSVDKATKMNEGKGIQKTIDECEKHLSAIQHIIESDPNNTLALKAFEDFSTKHTYYKSLTLKQKEDDVMESDELSFYECEEAAYIWFFLREHGFNEYVCAGILGNIMAEVGGHTLDLDVYCDLVPGYYGMCQWSLEFCPEVDGLDLESQCEYLISTIKKEIDNFGYRYRSNFNYSSFLELTNEEDAAVAFASCYERCETESYYMRRINAIIAYKYFVY